MDKPHHTSLETRKDPDTPRPLLGAPPSVSPGGCGWARGRCPGSLQLQREGWVERLQGCSPQACSLVSLLHGRAPGFGPVSQHLLGSCGGLLSPCRQRRDELALAKRDSAKPHLMGLPEGFGEGEQRGRAVVPCPQQLPKCQPRILSSCQAAHAGMALCPTPALLAAAWQEQAAGRDAGIPRDVAGGSRPSATPGQGTGQTLPMVSAAQTPTARSPVGQDNHCSGGGSWRTSQANTRSSGHTVTAGTRTRAPGGAKVAVAPYLLTPPSRGVGSPGISRGVRGEDAARPAQSRGDPRGGG